MYILEQFVIEFLVNSAYCSSSSVPSISNGVLNGYNTTINSVTYYQCNSGYSGNPYVTCNGYNNSNGQWSSISGSCSG